MELSHFLAKLIGFYLVIVAAWMLLRKDSFVEVIKGFTASPGLVAFSGFISLIGGLAILIGHPIWTLNWQGLITLIGALAVLQGILRITFPGEVQKLGKSIVKGNGYWILFIVVAVLGVVLSYFGLKGTENPLSIF